MIGNPLDAPRAVRRSARCRCSTGRIASGYTLYDGLQIKHLNEVIALLSYGAAVVGSVATAYLLWQPFK